MAYYCDVIFYVTLYWSCSWRHAIVQSSACIFSYPRVWTVKLHTMMSMTMTNDVITQKSTGYETCVDKELPCNLTLVERSIRHYLWKINTEKKSHESLSQCIHYPPLVQDAISSCQILLLPVRLNSLVHQSECRIHPPRCLGTTISYQTTPKE